MGKIPIHIHTDWALSSGGKNVKHTTTQIVYMDDYYLPISADSYMLIIKIVNELNDKIDKMSQGSLWHRLKTRKIRKFHRKFELEFKLDLSYNGWSYYQAFKTLNRTFNVCQTTMSHIKYKDCKKLQELSDKIEALIVMLNFEKTLC